MRKVLVVMGVPIDDLDVPEALARIEEFICEGRATGATHQIATVNADFVIKAQEDPELRVILQEADMATADGMPLVWGARLLGVRLPGRVTGADLVPALAAVAAEKGYSLYLLGGSPGVPARAAEVLRARYPTIRIVGAVAPPFAPVLNIDPALVEDIRNAQPDILLVAFGNPKQEKWIAMHAPELGVPVMMGVGGTLDFIAGVTRRAPEWMQRSGLEWVYRLVQEPRRLWRRYMVDLAGFGYFFTRQWFAMYPWRAMRPGARNPPLAPTATAVAPAPAVPAAVGSEPVLIEDAGVRVAVLSVGARLTLVNCEQFLAQAGEALAHTPHVVVDLAGATFVDSSGYGALVTVARRARAAGGELCLASLQPQVAQVLRVLRLEQFFSTYADTAAALIAAKDAGSVPDGSVPDDLPSNAAAPAALEPAAVATADGAAPADGAVAAGWQTVRAPRRLDAVCAPEFRTRCTALLAESPRLIVDLSETVFLPSAGLAALIALSREARSLNGELRLACLMPDALRVVKLAKLDGVFAIYPNITEAGR
jgi:N-acetylglucosaminyldiphosphoundecaprenol N-acetyl-beta-D-mannosaminyltransferase